MTILALLLPAGCGDEETEDSASSGVITYSRSGGIAGIGEFLEIGADGDAELTLGYGADAAVERFEVPADELETIQRGLGEVNFDEIDEGQESTCADCFVYEISYGGQKATSDDISLSEDFRAAAATLVRLAEEHGAGADKG